ncbi:Oidioi.mRNA.OKI2018_I69.chr1.g297.t1.cds [Oikopleura dioica]|uniref:Oidioi.mRNA.OKI2018_I69.chr1.g297.t1.cds n=1 Tax=Oikopleura dioica TaxID=34765 RepID=A0ABN7SJE5_OIKDI|nr:Oidioi.mRNA.OKI2018_I69.chr1.g297.t1.cds [Oikopleura dioica]
MKNLEKDEDEEFEPKRVLYEKLNDWENYDSESILGLIKTADSGFIFPSGRAAVHLAAIDRREKELRLMLRQNPDLVNLKSSSGMIPLAYAFSSEAVLIDKNSNGPISKLLLSLGSPNPFFYAFCICSSWEQFASLCEFIQKNLKKDLSLRKVLKEDLWMMLKTQNENRSDKESFEKAVITIVAIFSELETLDTRDLLKSFLSYIFKSKTLFLSTSDFEKLMSMLPMLAGYDMEPQMLLAMKFLNRQVDDNLINLDENGRKLKLLKVLGNYEKMVKLAQNLDLVEFKNQAMWILNYLFHVLRDEDTILPEEVINHCLIITNCLLPPDFRKLVKNVFSVDIIANDEKLENMFKVIPKGVIIKELILPLRQKFKSTFLFQRWPSISDASKSEKSEISAASSSLSLTSSFSMNEALQNDVTFDM